MTDQVRRYSSPLRAEQAEATRKRIIEAGVALLQQGDGNAFGMQDVADRAGVALRTVYRAFATKDELIEGVLGAIQERFAAEAGPPPTTAEEVLTGAASAVRTVFALEPLYRALFATNDGRDLHVAASAGREAEVLAAFEEHLRLLDEDRVQQFVALVQLLTSSKSVLFLKDYAGLDADGAAAAVSWGLTALVASVGTSRGKVPSPRPGGRRR